MKITILTLFPQVFREYFSSSIIGRAQKQGLVTIKLVNIRDFTSNKHKNVDDKSYGGGVGMIMRVDVVEKAIADVKKNQDPRYKEKVVLLDPAGKLFHQTVAKRYSTLDHLILVCGHYEGIDSRVSHFVDESISIGKYVLTGGEIPAMVISDALVRLIPGVLPKKEAIIFESYSDGKTIEYPQYTRPRTYKELKVPTILLSGNHKKIQAWRLKQATLRSMREEKELLK